MILFKLDEILNQLNISRNKFSNLSGIRPNTINDMCNGKTRRIEMETLESILNTLSILMGREVKISELIEYKKWEMNKENEN